uniref:Uncharacterized protein n=1 Tax=Nelumbo nucifera TaxID=4432 RepID=A0A822XP68_NELNU|nr:TPA_asm: hypothetical protein HUJ06_022008 [Nelumbo nucifera]
MEASSEVIDSCANQEEKNKEGEGMDTRRRSDTVNTDQNPDPNPNKNLEANGDPNLNPTTVSNLDKNPNLKMDSDLDPNPNHQEKNCGKGDLRLTELSREKRGRSLSQEEEAQDLTKRRKKRAKQWMILKVRSSASSRAILSNKHQSPQPGGWSWPANSE